MADRETALERLCDRVTAREEALLAALEALVVEIREDLAYLCRDASSPADAPLIDATRRWADRLAAELAQHREARPTLCPDCDHGIAGGRPCGTCGGTGYAQASR